MPYFSPVGYVSEGPTMANQSYKKIIECNLTNKTLPGGGGHSPLKTGQEIGGYKYKKGALEHMQVLNLKVGAK